MADLEDPNEVLMDGIEKAIEGNLEEMEFILGCNKKPWKEAEKGMATMLFPYGTWASEKVMIKELGSWMWMSMDSTPSLLQIGSTSVEAVLTRGFLSAFSLSPSLVGLCIFHFSYFTIYKMSFHIIIYTIDFIYLLIYQHFSVF